MLYAFDAQSSTYVIEQLLERGLLRNAGNELFGNSTIIKYQITARGWEKLDSLRTASGSAKKQAFVAMWFHPDMEEFYTNGIGPAVEACGLRSFRVDLKEHNNKICDEIIAEIRRSRILVADFTGDRGGVYYEAGFASGLGIPVIWTVRKDFLTKVHFDTRQYNHIVYETADELRSKLENRIRATIP